MLQQVFPEYSGRTHMPFIDGERLLFCTASSVHQQSFACQGTGWRRLGLPQPASRCVSYFPWKLHYCDRLDCRPKRIATGLPAAAVECSPAVFRERGMLHVSFVGVVPVRNHLESRLYLMSGTSLTDLAPAIPVYNESTRVGFVSLRYRCYAPRDELMVEDRATGTQQRLVTPFERLYRVSYRTDAPNCLLITGKDEQQQPRTLLFDLVTETTREVWTDQPVYKPSLCGRRIVFPRIKHDGFENRELWQGDYTLVPTSLEVHSHTL